MKLLISKAKEYSVQLRMVLCLWAFVIAKFLLLKDGAAATVFTPKAFSIFLFSVSFAAAAFILYLVFSKYAERRTADIACASLMLVYYCAFNSRMLYPLTEKHLFACAFVIAACVLLLVKQVRLLSVPVSICAVLFEPAVSSAVLPALVCISAAMVFNVKKDEKQDKRKQKQKKKVKASFLQKAAQLSAKIPPAVYLIAFVLITAFSYFWYFHVNPYGPYTSAEKMLIYAKNISLVLLKNLLAVIFSLAVWIIFIRSSREAVKYFFIAAAGALLCCASRLVLSSEMLMPEIYLCSALFTGFAVKLLFLQAHGEVIPEAIGKAKKFVPALLIAVPIYTGICYSYIG